MKVSVLKKKIKQHGFTQESLARKMNVSRAMVNRWCSGKSTLPPERKLQISAILQDNLFVSPSHLQNFIYSRLQMDIASFSEFYGASQKSIKSWVKGTAPLPSALQELILLYDIMKKKADKRSRT